VNFLSSEAWDDANVVVSHKVKLSFCHLIEKIEALVMGVFQYFFSRAYWSLDV
jgi:hypothetical protein